jgi:zinc finger BED domain-containing protein 1 (E3 SUMO-protein ligase ZBED1)
VYTDEQSLYMDLLFVMWCSLSCIAFHVGTTLTQGGLAFRRFTSKLDCMFVPPSRKYCIKLLMVLYEIAWVNLKIKLAAIQDELGDQCFSLQLDLWTSSAMDSYGALCVTYIDSDFKMHCLLLACTSFPGSHTAEHIKEWVHSTLNKFNLIVSNFHTVTIDGDTTGRAAIGDMGFLYVIICIAHELQRCVCYGIGWAPKDDPPMAAARDLLAKARKLASYLKNSPKTIDRLGTICADLNVKNLRVMIDVVTRWFSTWAMLDRLMAMKNSIVRLFHDHDDMPGDYSLSVSDWRDLRYVKAVLTPLKEATKL